MTNPMSTYRKLTKDEVLSLATRIRFEDDINLDTLREGIKRLFGPTAHKATFHWDLEYNDETFDLRPTSVEVEREDGTPLVRAAGEDDYDEELHDFFREVEISEVGENADMGEVVVFINETNPLELPDLYVKES